MVGNRRKFLQLVASGTVISLAGCAVLESEDDDGGGNGGDTDSSTTRECTDVSVRSFDWNSESGWLSDPPDEFSGTIVNQADMAGTVTVTVTFWESESTRNSVGTISESVSIGAQESKGVTIEGNPPSDEAEWATMEVSDQECRTV